jgi:Cdc6-like AAA superfamily ATPase
MKIILLSGRKGTGKTTTVHLLYDELIRCKAKLLQMKKIGRNDYEWVVLYKGKKVALQSHGDIMYRVYQAPIIYSYVDCLVLAHSQGGVQKNRIKNLIQGLKKQHILIPKTVSRNNANYAADNMKDCMAMKAAI